MTTPTAVPGDRIGSYRHQVTVDQRVQGPPDPDGGYTETYVPLDPPVWNCSITRPPPRAGTRSGSDESLGPGSVMAQATHVLTGRYHPGLDVHTRVTFNGRILNALYCANRDERDIETVLVCAEVVS